MWLPAWQEDVVGGLVGGWIWWVDGVIAGVVVTEFGMGIAIGRGAWLRLQSA